jgi:heptosyltransferase II
MQKILVVQTAFIGDVVLATGLLESLHQQDPTAGISILVRKGNEALFSNHPFVKEVLVWDKKTNKYQHLFQIIQEIRQRKFDLLINVQRFAATGLITVFSGAKTTIGFDKNPFSLFFSKRIKHFFSNGDIDLHEIQRNHQLIATEEQPEPARPKLYPSDADFAAVASYTQQPYICMAPASVWFTKQYPETQWIKLLQLIPKQFQVYLLGAPSDGDTCNRILAAANCSNVKSLAGQLNFLQSAALMQTAVMNYVNDSAPMHFASSVNAPVTAIYCSTIPAFGYGPLSDKKHIVEVKQALDCRPCGIHGRKECPKGHFNCANLIDQADLLATLPA